MSPITREMLIVVYSIVAAAAIGDLLVMGRFLALELRECRREGRLRARFLLAASVFGNALGLLLIFGSATIVLQLPAAVAAQWRSVYYAVLALGGVILAASTLYRVRFASEAWARRWSWPALLLLMVFAAGASWAF